jgi:hypothetical protein
MNSSPIETTARREDHRDRFMNDDAEFGGSRPQRGGEVR